MNPVLGGVHSASCSRENAHVKISWNSRYESAIIENDYIFEGAYL
jgi:hypothetical protein